MRQNNPIDFGIFILYLVVIIGLVCLAYFLHSSI